MLLSQCFSNCNGKVLVQILCIVFVTCILVNQIVLKDFFSYLTFHFVTGEINCQHMSNNYLKFLVWMAIDIWFLQLFYRYLLSKFLQAPYGVSGYHCLAKYFFKWQFHCCSENGECFLPDRPVHTTTALQVHNILSMS